MKITLIPPGMAGAVPRTIVGVTSLKNSRKASPSFLVGKRCLHVAAAAMRHGCQVWKIYFCQRSSTNGRRSEAKVNFPDLTPAVSGSDRNFITNQQGLGRIEHGHSMRGKSHHQGVPRILGLRRHLRSQSPVSANVWLRLACRPQRFDLALDVSEISRIRLFQQMKIFTVNNVQCDQWLKFAIPQRAMGRIRPYGWSRTTVSWAATSHLPLTFLSTIRIRPSTVTPAFVAW